MKRIRPWLLLGGIWMSGCSTVPFPAPEPFAVEQGAREDVPVRFESHLAPTYEQVNAIVFRFRMREIAALGYASVDLPARSFSVACLNPVGIKLFDVVCERGTVEGRFVAPEIEKYGGDLARAAGDDLKRAYFDWSPPAGTPYRIRNDRLVFSAEDETGRTEYRYAGPDGRLAEKIRIEKGRVRWSVEYRGFRQAETGWIPAGIVIRNRQYGYRLVVSAREMEP